MVDLDEMEAQLERAVNGAPAAGSGSTTVRQLMELGRLEEADASIAGQVSDPDRVTWTTMRALLDGRRPAVTAGLAALLELARASGDAATWDRYWTQRWWAALEWGEETERSDVLDHCRERAYRFDDAPWWGALTLTLAGLGRVEEATRAFDESYRPLGGGAAPADLRLDLATNLVEAAALLGDGPRTVLGTGSLDRSDGPLLDRTHRQAERCRRAA